MFIGCLRFRAKVGQSRTRAESRTRQRCLPGGDEEQILFSVSASWGLATGGLIVHFGQKVGSVVTALELRIDHLRQWRSHDERASLPVPERNGIESAANAHPLSRERPP
jgi:hypothetical protein